MFIADRLIYLQLYKTGCSHIERLLDSLISGEIVGKHNRLPENLNWQNKHIVGSIRNPWDWYISLWAFGCGAEGGLYQNVTARKLRGHGFKKTLGKTTLRDVLWVYFHELNKPVDRFKKVYSDSQNPELFREWLRLILDPKRKYNLGDSYGISSISAFAGLYTYAYIWLFSNELSDLFTGKVNTLDQLHAFDESNHILNSVIRNESLEDDFVQVVQKAGYELSDEQIQQVYSSKRTNSSARKREVTYYYDSETIQLVTHRDQFLVQKYGYLPPQI